MKKTLLNRFRFTSFGLAISVFSCVSLFASAFPQHENAAEMAKSVVSLVANQKPLTGNSSAEIKVVGFIDYQCPACRENFAKVENRLAGNPNAAFYVQQFPMGNHPLSTPAATLALKAEDKGIFEAVHRELLGGKDLTQHTLDAVSRKYAISTKPTVETRESLARERKEAIKMGDSFVPSFVVSDSHATKLYTWRDVLARFPKK